MRMRNQRQGGSLAAKIHPVAGRIFARKLKEHQIEEINPAQGRILFVLWRQDGISINELAKRASLGKSTLTSMLDRLAARGLIQRTVQPEDRRSFIVTLTPKGRSLADRVNRQLTELEARIRSRISARDLSGFRAVMDAIEDAAGVARKKEE